MEKNVWNFLGKYNKTKKAHLKKRRKREDRRGEGLG